MDGRQNPDERGIVATAPHRFTGEPLLLLNVMPMAMFVIDTAATVVFVNDRLVEMIGMPREVLVGQSALDFIDERDVEFATSLLTSGPQFPDSVMGPSRIRYVDATGARHFTQVWAHQAPPELGVDGYIISLTQESVRDVLATAVSSVASDAPLERTLGAIAAAGRAAPLDGVGTVLLVEPTSPTDEERFRVFGDWPLAPNLINAFGTPWRRCLVRAAPQDVLDCTLDADARAAAEMSIAGLASAWVRPVFGTDGKVAAVFIVWRRGGEVISANQEAHISDAIRLAHLALEQAGNRRELEEAARRDALTGVGNRASLNDRIDEEDELRSVLFIDLDHFKHVNDTFGHGVGDEVIAQVGRRITEAVRRGDDVYRTGGDEFIVVCAVDADDERDDDRAVGPAMPVPSAVGRSQAATLITLAERIIERLGAAFDCREHRVRIGATIGIAGGRAHDGTPRDLDATILAADRAMYVAKDRGRGGVHHADVER